MNSETYDLAVRLRHELHAHPELSTQESWTKARLMSFLQDHTRLEVVDREAWFYAVYRASPGAGKLAFRADFDALPIEETLDMPYRSTVPGVSHKCGHDGHSATLAAFAMEVDRLGAENDVYFIFQHAEETGEGAKVCASLIKEEGIDEIFGYHNSEGFAFGEVFLRSGQMQCASTGMSMYFAGVPSHASEPGFGRNPALAIARIICDIPQLNRPEDHCGLVLCTVIHAEIGKPAFGTSAGKGVLRVTLRAEREAEMIELQARLDALAYGLATEYGLEYRKELCEYFPENRNHDESAEKIRQVCARLHIPVHEYEHPKRGSEDFGYYTQATGGAFFNIGAGDGPPAHSGGYDFADAIIPIAVSVFKELAGVPQD